MKFDKSYFKEMFNEDLGLGKVHFPDQKTVMAINRKIKADAPEVLKDYRKLLKKLDSSFSTGKEIVYYREVSSEKYRSKTGITGSHRIVMRDRTDSPLGKEVVYHKGTNDTTYETVLAFKEEYIPEGSMGGKYAKDVSMYQKAKPRKNTGKKIIGRKKTGDFPKGWEKNKKPGKKQKTIQGLPISKRDDKDPEAMDRFHRRKGYYPEDTDPRGGKWVGNDYHMSKKDYAKLHKDFKSKIKGKPYATAMDPKTGATILTPVILEAAPLFHGNRGGSLQQRKQREIERKQKIARAADAREKELAKQNANKSKRGPRMTIKYRKGNEKFSEESEIEEGGLGRKLKKASDYPSGKDFKKVKIKGKDFVVGPTPGGDVVAPFSKREVAKANIKKKNLKKNAARRAARGEELEFSETEFNPKYKNNKPNDPADVKADLTRRLIKMNKKKKEKSEEMSPPVQALANEAKKKMIKVKLNPKKKIGYTITSPGPDGKPGKVLKRRDVPGKKDVGEGYIAALKEAVDKETVRELVLYITNDGQLYRQRTTPIIKNLSKKVGKGTYDGIKAVKAFMYLATDGIKKYEKDHAGPGWAKQINKETKQAIAQELLDNYEEEIGE